MNIIVTAFALLVALALVSPGSVLFAQTGTQDRPGPPKPISAELAKKCRALAIQAHPTQQPGSRYGSGHAQREYYQQCIAKGGNVEN
jgi:hypothetical protein